MVPEDSWPALCTCLNVVAFNICQDSELCVRRCVAALFPGSPSMFLDTRQEKQQHVWGEARADWVRAGHGGPERGQAMCSAG